MCFRPALGHHRGRPGGHLGEAEEVILKLILTWLAASWTLALGLGLFVFQREGEEHD
jgi:hypothetical protein